MTTKRVNYRYVFIIRINWSIPFKKSKDYLTKHKHKKLWLSYLNANIPKTLSWFVFVNVSESKSKWEIIDALPGFNLWAHFYGHRYVFVGTFWCVYATSNNNGFKKYLGIIPARFTRLPDGSCGLSFGELVILGLRLQIDCVYFFLTPIILLIISNCYLKPRGFEIDP